MPGKAITQIKEYSIKYLTCTSQNCQSFQKQRNLRNCGTADEAKERTLNILWCIYQSTCILGCGLLWYSWMGTWNKKRSLGEKLVQIK